MMEVPPETKAWCIDFPAYDSSYSIELTGWLAGTNCIATARKKLYIPPPPISFCPRFVKGRNGVDSIKVFLQGETQEADTLALRGYALSLAYDSCAEFKGITSAWKKRWNSLAERVRTYDSLSLRYHGGEYHHRIWHSMLLLGGFSDSSWQVPKHTASGTWLFSLAFQGSCTDKFHLEYQDEFPGNLIQIAPSTENIPYEIRCSPATGIPEPPAPASLLRAWPNPTSGRLEVAFSATIGQPWRLMLYDMLGRRLMEHQGQARQAETHLSLDLTAWPEGVYLLRLWDNKKTSQALKVWRK